MPDFGRWTSNGGDPSLNEINRSERFIEALSLERQVYATDREEAELAVLLAGWRDDARRAPMSGIATPREAVTALNKATAHGRVRHFPMALVGSMAAAVLCLGGFGAAVYGAGPGDALYGVRGMFFGSEPVKRDVGIDLASSELKQVQQLIDEGQWEQAQQKLQTITTTVATVDDEQRKQELVDRWQQLSVQVENRDPNATVPPDAPPVVLPEVTATTTPSSPAESTSGESPTSGTESTSEPTTPTSSSSASESATSSPAPAETATSQPTTAQPSSTAAPTPSSTPSSAAPTTSAPPSPTSAAPATRTSSAPTTSAAPAAEVPPAPATTTVTLEVAPTSVPSAPPRATTPPETGGGANHESPAAGQGERGQGQQGAAAPGAELPLVPGLGGSQR